MIDRNKFNPVRPISKSGSFLVNTIRSIFHIRRLFGGTDYMHALSAFHEDPRKMGLANQVYLAHKYYYKALLQPDVDSDIVTSLRRNTYPAADGFVAEKTITMSAGGDLIPYHCITEKVCRNLWTDAGPFFFDADIVAANLETPFHRGRKPSFVPEVMVNHMYFNASEEQFNVFSGLGKYKGYDILSTANNHSMDMGEEGIHETIAALSQHNVHWAGTNTSDDDDDDTIPVLTRNGIRVAFISFTFSLNNEVCPPGREWLVNHIPLNEPDPDISRLVEKTRVARSMADFVVAFLHMGCAYQAYPSAVTVNNMHRIARATGIDVILGGHPHNAQPAEFVKVSDPFTGEDKHSFIIYSQGDFVAYDIFKWCHLPLLLKFHISKGTCNGKEQTRLTHIDARLFYTHATIRNGAVRQLEFISAGDAARAVAASGDHDSIRELKELTQFAEQYLYPGTLGQLIKKQGL